jgi:hypothetical protein
MASKILVSIFSPTSLVFALKAFVSQLKILSLIFIYDFTEYKTMLSTVAYVSPGYGKSGYGYGSVYGTLYSIFSFIVTVIGKGLLFKTRKQIFEPGFRSGLAGSESFLPDRHPRKITLDPNPGPDFKILFKPYFIQKPINFFSFLRALTDSRTHLCLL